VKKLEVVMPKKTHHVIPSPKGGWSVIKSSSKKASKSFKNKEKAVEWGKEVSKNQKTELIIHKKDGTVQDKIIHEADKKSSRAEKK
jgi:uncharacterized protein YcnI